MEKVIQAFENCTAPEMNDDDDETCVDCIRAWECPWEDCQERDSKLIDIPLSLAIAAIELLKEQKLPPVKPENLEERTTKWLDKMTAEERLKEIAAILDDWDGYRTAKGLGGLINEIWAYALYPVKTREPRVMTLEEVKAWNKRNVLCREPIFLEDRYSFVQHWTLDEIGGMDLEKYGDLTRCWTSRPTDEKRKAVKWDG